VGEVVDSELVVLVGLSDGAATVDVEASGAGSLVVVDVSVALLFVVASAICAGVEVDERNGGGCTA